MKGFLKMKHRSTGLFFGFVLLVLLTHFPLFSGEPASLAEQKKQQAQGVWKEIPEAEAKAYLRWRDSLSAEEREWELTLEKHLGSFYFPHHVKAQNLKNAGKRYPDWGFSYVKDDPKLPRILLIGDSISRACTSGVRKALAGEANLHRAPANCGSSENGIRFLDEWLGKKKWDCIVFNFGIHDRALKEEQYRKNLETIIARLRKTGARLFWARTTPIYRKETGKTDSRIDTLNRIADEVMKRHSDITVLDLWGAIVNAPGGMRSQIGKDNTHLTVRGNGRIIRLISHGIRERFLQNTDHSTEWYCASTPKMKEFRLPSPFPQRRYTRKEFQIDKKRIRTAPLNEVFLRRDQMLAIAERLLNSPEGARIWNYMCSAGAIRHLNPWNLVSVSSPDYTNRFYSCMNLLPVVYFLTGHKETGRLIHDYTMHSMTLGDAFWYGDKILNEGFPDKRIGTLSNSQLGMAYITILAFASDVFTPEEKARIEQRVRRDGLEACREYVEINKKTFISNFTAVLAGGLYIHAKYFQDKPGKQAGIEAVGRFLNTAVEDDGSYGEGFGYFKYPIGVLNDFFYALPEKECRALLQNTPLRGTAEWYAYRYLFTVREGKTLPVRTVFCDDNFTGAPTVSSCLLFARMLNNPLAAWIGQKFSFHPETWWIGTDWKNLLFDAPASRSPVEMNLPLVRAFRNGETFIRSSWGDNSTVFSLYGALPTRTAQNHQRPERNSFNLGAFGVPVVMSSGYTNRFTGPLHEYTSSIRSSNTIQIDDSEQRWWWSLPKPTIPETSMLICREGKLADVLMNEGAKAYKENMKSACRTVIHLKETGTFVLIDTLVSADGPHRYTSRIHLNNLEKDTQLEQRNANSWVYRHPELKMELFLDADCKFLAKRRNSDLIINPKFPVRDLKRQEKERGNVWTLELSNLEKKENVRCFLVLQPQRKNAFEPFPVARRGNVLTVGTTQIDCSGPGILIRSGNETEMFLPEKLELEQKQSSRRNKGKTIQR